MNDCILTTARFFDSAANQWGYEVICVAEDHDANTEPCPEEREIFRRARLPEIAP